MTHEQMKELLRQFFELRPTASSQKIAAIVEQLCNVYSSSPEDYNINSQLDKISADIDYLPAGKPCQTGVSELFEGLYKYRNYDELGLRINCCELQDGRIKYIISHQYARFAPFRIEYKVEYEPATDTYIYHGWKDIQDHRTCRVQINYDQLLQIIANDGEVQA